VRGTERWFLGSDLSGLLEGVGEIPFSLFLGHGEDKGLAARLLDDLVVADDGLVDLDEVRMIRLTKLAFVHEVDVREGGLGNRQRLALRGFEDKGAAAFETFAGFPAEELLAHFGSIWVYVRVE
jgi:hypothetical protein